MRIALLGTRGVPARYGGLEVAAEQIGERLVERGHEVVVYCRGEDRSERYRGMERVVLPAVRSRLGETLSHTLASVAHLARHRADVALVFNAGNALVLPALRATGVPHAIHVDGLGGKRAKWGSSGERYYLLCEKIAARSRRPLVADSVGMQDYYRERYGVSTFYIPYGATQVEDAPLGRLGELGLEAGGFHLVRARLTPENQTDLLLEGVTRSSARLPVVVVGEPSRYEPQFEARVRALADADPRIRLLGAVWDDDLVDALYAGSVSYLHGHTIGGTSPALLRAMGAGAAITAADVLFTREVVGDAAIYVRDADDVASAYEALCLRILHRPADGVTLPATFGAAAG